MKLTDARPDIYKRALEITWLAVIFLVPLFFNLQSYRIFVLNKASLLQFLVLAMLAFWVADWLLNRAGQNGPKKQGVFVSPLHLAILVFGLVAVLATVASITPAISFWGSYNRKAGLLTLICWILFFLIVAQQIRNRRQLLRAVYALLLSSAIVSLAGILQYYFTDAISTVFPSPYAPRVASTIGNPLFLSSFLAMVIPFNLALIIHSWSRITSTCHPERQRRVSKPSARLTTSQILRSLRSRFFASLRMTGGNTEQSSHNRGKWANTIRLIGLVILLALQFWCLWLAQYSITILLYVIAPIVFIIISGIVKRKKLLLSVGAACLIGLAIIAGLLLVPLLDSSPSVEHVKTGNLESTMPSEAIGLHTLADRVQYWQSTVEIFLKSPEVPFSNDKFHFLRKFIGYGPETFTFTFQLFFPDKLKSSYTSRYEFVDRPHNDYLYLATTMGLLGLLSFLSILAVFFYLCFRYLRRATADIDKLVLIAMVAAMAQYMADIFFNLSTISPELVFWLMLAMTPVIGRFIWRKEPASTALEDAAQPESSAASHVTRTRSLLSAVCAVALLIAGTIIAVRPFLADIYLHKGLKLQSEGNGQAIFAFDKATNIEPEESIYWHSLGLYTYYVARHVTGEPFKSQVLSLATSDYHKAVELNPCFALERVFLADVYTYWAESGATDKWPAALSFYDEASQSFPDNAVILNRWSLALIIKGDFDEAQKKLDYAASVDPTWAETSFISGLLLAREEKNNEAALKVIQPITDKSSNLNYFTDLCNNLTVYDMVSPLGDSLEIYTQETPDDWIAHALLGITGMFGDNLDKTLGEFNTAMMLVPGNNAGDLFRAILRLSSMSEPLKTALPSVAADWKAKLIQSPERDTLLPELDKLIDQSAWHFL